MSDDRACPVCQGSGQTTSLGEHPGDVHVGTCYRCLGGGFYRALSPTRLYPFGRQSKRQSKPLRKKRKRKISNERRFSWFQTDPTYLLQFTPGVVDITPTRSFSIDSKRFFSSLRNAPKNDSLDKMRIGSMANGKSLTPARDRTPIMDIKGKDYLQPMWRLVWFREEKPLWSIETDFTSVTEKDAICRAVIKNEEGRIVATGHYYESRSGFEAFHEKVETMAIARALAHLGYGTQFMGEKVVPDKKLADGPDNRSKAVHISDLNRANKGMVTDEPPMPTKRIVRRSNSWVMKNLVFAGNPAPALLPEVPFWQDAPEPAPLGGYDATYIVPFGKKYKGMALDQVGPRDCASFIAFLKKDRPNLNGLRSSVRKLPQFIAASDNGPQVA